MREALQTAVKPLYAVEMGDKEIGEEEKCAKPTDAEGRFLIQYYLPIPTLT